MLLIKSILLVGLVIDGLNHVFHVVFAASDQLRIGNHEIWIGYKWRFSGWRRPDIFINNCHPYTNFFLGDVPYHVEIRVRMAAVDEDVWPPPATEKPQVPDPSLRIPYSDEIAGGKLDVKDVIQPVYDEINKEYGLNEKQMK